ncbi:hypothetical protein C1T31_05645 [Hanstruepera neustonica]|uniref:Uncharacterized protein n=2 Tax=Hanstruepera neustonica TaxID=1445657 RepID=A0A2K1E0N4_9FLAO|nr:hypothetical protein C1T31_05645 [Hanstruepera neustonica]
MSSLILAASSAVADSIIDEPDDYASNKTETVLSEKSYLETVLFHNPDSEPVAIEDIQVLELEEDVCLPFEISKYLPKNFNPLKGKDDLDWSKITLIELEEDVNLGFDTRNYLPKHFNPYKGMLKPSTYIK